MTLEFGEFLSILYTGYRASGSVILLRENLLASIILTELSASFKCLVGLCS